MPFTISLVQSISEGSTTISANQTFAPETVTKFAETVNDGASDLEFAVSVDITELLVFYMKATQAMTVKTNSSGAPDETFVLAANSPVVWRAGDTAIFGGDVTSLFVTNSSGSNGVLNIMYGMDT